jgi:hypothetical protein
MELIVTTIVVLTGIRSAQTGNADRDAKFGDPGLSARGKGRCHISKHTLSVATDDNILLPGAVTGGGQAGCQLFKRNGVAV